MLSWEEVVANYGIEDEDIRRYCNDGLPVYDKDSNRIYATSQCEPCFPSVPTISWIKVVFDPKHEFLDFESHLAEKNTEFSEKEGRRQYVTPDCRVIVDQESKKIVYDYELLRVIVAQETGDVLILRKKIIPGLNEDLLSTSLANFIFSEYPSTDDFDSLISSCKAGYERDLKDRNSNYPESFLNLYSIDMNMITSLFKKFDSIEIEFKEKRFEKFEFCKEIIIKYKSINKLNRSAKERNIKFEITDYTVAFFNDSFVRKNKESSDNEISSKVIFSINKEKELNDKFNFTDFDEDEVVIYNNGCTVLQVYMDDYSFYAPSIESVKFVLEAMDMNNNVDYCQNIKKIHLASCIETYTPKKYRLPEGAISKYIFDFTQLFPGGSNISLFYYNINYNACFYFKKENIENAILKDSPTDKVLLNRKICMLQSEHFTKKEKLEALRIKLIEKKSYVEIHDKLYPKDKYKKEDNGKKIKNSSISRDIRVAIGLFPPQVRKFFPHGQNGWREYNKSPDVTLKNLAEALLSDAG